MNIVVMGVGALGGLYGGLLARSGHAVTFVARGRTLDALARNGLHVRSKLFGEFTVPAAVTGNAVTIEPPDLILLSVKAYDLDSAGAAIAPITGPQTSLLAIQNGIDHLQRLSMHVPRERIVPGVVYISANVSEPGVIDQVGGPGRVLIGELDGGKSPRIEQIGQIFSEAGVPIEVLDDIWKPLWAKFMTICAMSGVTALTRLTLQEIFDCPESRTLYRDVMAEITAIARASGVDLPESASDETLATMLTMPALPLRGSMAYDLLAGRRLEIDTLNGTAARMGEELGVPVPMNRAIYYALKPYAGGAPSPPA